MNEKIKSVIGTVSLIFLGVSIFMLIGTAGSVDTDIMNLSEAVKSGIVWLIVLAISTAGIVISERDEDEYGRL